MILTLKHCQIFPWVCYYCTMVTFISSVFPSFKFCKCINSSRGFIFQNGNTFSGERLKIQYWRANFLILTRFAEIQSTWRDTRSLSKDASKAWLIFLSSGIYYRLLIDPGDQRLQHCMSSRHYKHGLRYHGDRTQYLRVLYHPVCECIWKKQEATVLTGCRKRNKCAL